MPIGVHAPREMIALSEKKLSRFQPYKSSSSLALQSPSPVLGLAATTAGKEGSSVADSREGRRIQKKELSALNVMSHSLLGIMQE